MIIYQTKPIVFITVITVGGNVPLKIIKRVLIALVSLIILLVFFLAASIAVDAALGGPRIDAVSNTLIPGQGGPDVRAYVARPDGRGPFPAVIMVHEFYGLNPSIVSKAEGLAQEGYLVIAPDTFRGSTTTWIPRAIYQVVTTRPEQVNADLDSVYAWLEQQPAVDPHRIAVLGFCYGGRTALVYSLHNPGLAATAIFYGQPEIDPAVLQSLPGPVLGIFGGADTSIPLADVRAFETALQTANIPHEITIYDGQPHAFVHDMDSIRAGGAQAKAWSQLLDFLKKNLKDGMSARPAPSLAYHAGFPAGYYFRLVLAHMFHMH